MHLLRIGGMRGRTAHLQAVAILLILLHLC
nr:MAG TPA: hypothetical protein [Caudoviricetes sp.]